MQLKQKQLFPGLYASLKEYENHGKLFIEINHAGIW